MALTNEELLMLDTLIYVDKKYLEGKDTVSSIIDAFEKDNFQSDTASMSPDEWRTLAENIKKHENLKNYKITNFKEDDVTGMRAACFVDDKNNPSDVNVVFRGTSCDYEWRDDGKGAYMTDTVVQKQAAEYVNSLPEKYGNNMTATGHSKGGNNAQYVTITTDRIGKCASYDGEGFSNEFIEKYKDKITARAGRITSISSKNDYVNVLMIPIAGTKIYLDTPHQDNFLLNHKPNIMLKDDGTFCEETEISDLSKFINEITTYYISKLPEPQKQIVADATLELVIAALNNDFNSVINDPRKLVPIVVSIILMVRNLDGFTLYKSLGDIYNFINNKIEDTFFPHLKVNISQLLSDADDMSFEIEEILKEVNSVYDDVQALGAMWQGTASDKFATSFGEEYTKINEYLTELKKCVDHVKISAEDYNSCEQQIYSMVESISV